MGLSTRWPSFPQLTAAIHPTLKKRQPTIMLKNLLTLLDAAEPKNEKIGVELASAALLMEIIHADYNCSDAELASARTSLKKAFSLDDEQLSNILDKAKKLHGDAVSIHPFVEAINKDFDADKKYRLIASLWQVAFADGELDRFEQHFIRKIAELLYVPHSEFIRAKLEAMNRL